MAALAHVGFTGMYLRQVRRIGVLGLVGFFLLAVAYLALFGLRRATVSALASVFHGAAALAG